MSLKFYPFLCQNDVLDCGLQSGQTIIISLVDLRPQQLPITEREFIFPSPNQSDEPTNEFANQSQEHIIYSNLKYMLWVSQPITLADTYLKQAIYASLIVDEAVVRKIEGIPKHSREQIEELFEQFNEQQPQQSVSTSDPTGYLVTPSTYLSSSVVYEFGSKYIRFEHNTFADYRQNVFGSCRLTNKASKIRRSYLKELQEIPYYVVIKSNGYTQQRSYELFKVKLARKESSFGNGSMEIQSKKVMGINKNMNNQHSNTTTPFQLHHRQVVDMTIKLLQLPINPQTEVNLHSTPTQSTHTGTQSTVNQNEQKVSRLAITFTEPNPIKMLNYPFLISLLHRYMFQLYHPPLRQSSQCLKQTPPTNRQLNITSSVIEGFLCQYITCIAIKHNLTQLKNQLQNQSNLLKTTTITMQTLNHNPKNQTNNNKTNSDLLERTLQIFNFIYMTKIQQSKQSTRLDSSRLTFDQIKYIQQMICKQILSSFKVELGQFQQRKEGQIYGFACLLKKITDNHSFVSATEIKLIQSLNVRLKQFTQQNMFTLIRNQAQSFISQNISITTYSQLQWQSIPSLGISLPKFVYHDFSQQLFVHLSDKLSSHHIKYTNYLPIIFSYPLQIQFLKSALTSKDNQIHELNQRITQLEMQLSQKQQTISDLQRKIVQFKQDQLFHQQVLNELNSTQNKLFTQIDEKKKLIIDHQCSKIMNIQCNQSIECYKLKQLRSLQEKNNFLQAISHLSKQNQHFITLSQQQQCTIQSLNQKIDKYQLIDLQMNSISLKNHQLSEQNQAIKRWKATVEDQHKQLLKSQVAKFNYVLNQNYSKFTEQKMLSQKMKELLLELTLRLQTKTKECSTLSDEINYIKHRHYHANHLHFQCSPNQQQSNHLPSTDQFYQPFTNQHYNTHSKMNLHLPDLISAQVFKE